MKTKYWVCACLTFLIILGVTGCESTNSVNEGPENPEPVNQVDDFRVEIFSEEDDTPEIYATITYLGNRPQIEVQHSEVLIFFNLYNKGKELFPKWLPNEGKSTTLVKNEPLKMPSNEDELSELDPGTYEVEAVASFSMDKTDYRISVSTNIVIE